jgi:hypothetical protein
MFLYLSLIFPSVSHVIVCVMCPLSCFFADRIFLLSSASKTKEVLEGYEGQATDGPHMLVGLAHGRHD